MEWTNEQTTERQKAEFLVCPSAYSAWHPFLMLYSRYDMILLLKAFVILNAPSSTLTLAQFHYFFIKVRFVELLSLLRSFSWCLCSENSVMLWNLSEFSCASLYCTDYVRNNVVLWKKIRSLKNERFLVWIYGEARTDIGYPLDFFLD